MFKKQIIICNLSTGETKVFNINLGQLEDIIDFIAYNNGILKNDMYSFSNPISFQIIDLYLSNLSTPQPLLRGIA